MYCHASKQWAMIEGDSSLSTGYGIWGTKGLSSPNTIPPALQGSIGWTDNNGHLYMFGGFGGWGGTLMSNALWMYTIDSCCSACNTGITGLNFNATDTVLCPGTCLDLNNNSQSYNAYHWLFPGGNPSFSNSPFPQNICYASPGSYDITLIATGCNAQDTLTFSNYITVIPNPPPQSIIQSGDTLFALSGAVSYQWYYYSSIINGATDYFYLAPMNGNYSVVATDNNGCEVEAAINNVLAHSQWAVNSLQFAIFPNPVEEELIIKTEVPLNEIEISIYNLLVEKIPLAVSCCPWTVDCRPLPPGLYYLELTAGEKIFRSKFVKQ